MEEIETAAGETPAECGPVERAVRGDIEALGDLDGMRPSLAATALALARELDAGTETSTAALARELRETLAALTAASEAEDAAARLAAELSAPLIQESGSA